MPPPDNRRTVIFFQRAAWLLGFAAVLCSIGNLYFFNGAEKIFEESARNLELAQFYQKQMPIAREILVRIARDSQQDPALVELLRKHGLNAEAVINSTRPAMPSQR